MADAVDKKEEKPSSSRWWEFYVVRYALGTVFGVLIVNMLARSGLAIPFPEGRIEEITKPEGLPLLIGYGLAYCYLASAPILVFHSARFSMQRTGYRKSFIACVLFAFVVSIVWSNFARHALPSGTLVLAGLAIGMIILITLTQIQSLVAGMHKTKDMWSFYLDLDRNRRLKENRELVDSYRHLREHGNAFFVVFMEILLGWGFYIAGKVSLFSPKLLTDSSCKTPIESCNESFSIGLIQTVILLLIWIIPAALVWTIGCLLEQEFANDKSIGPVSNDSTPDTSIEKPTN